MISRTVRLPALCAALVVWGACALPSNVRYRCEPDGSCAVSGQVCAADGYCHLPGEYGDGGALGGGGGSAQGGGAPEGGGAQGGGGAGCVGRDVSAECAAAECGSIFDGCVDVKCPRNCPSGPQECGANEPNRCGFPHLCTAEGWCWENPYPQGYTLVAGWRADAKHTWWVGENGTVLFRDAERASLPALPPLDRDVSFWSVHGTSPSNVFVVGQRGTILHWDGASWTRESGNGVSTAAYRVVHALEDGGAMVGANGGVVLTRVASVGDPLLRWMQEPLPANADVRDLVRGPDGRPVVLNRNKELYVRGDAGWSLLARADLLADPVALASWRGHLVVGGAGGQFLYTNALPDGGWQGLDAGFSVNELKVSDDGALVVVGLPASNQLAWFDDQGITRLNTQLNLTGNFTVVPAGPKQVAAAGANGFLADIDLTLNPQTGVVLHSSPVVRKTWNFNGVCGLRDDRMFVMGTGELLPLTAPGWGERSVSATGIEWKFRTQAHGLTTQWNSCFAEESRAFLLGNDGKFITLFPTGVARNDDFTDGLGGNFWGVYNAGWGDPSTGYFFTKTGGAWFGEVTFSDGGATGTFRGTDTATNQPMHGVWGLGGEVFAVGELGAVLYFDGTSWDAGFVDTSSYVALHGATLADGTRRFIAPTDDGKVGTFEKTPGASDWVMAVSQVFDPNENPRRRGSRSRAWRGSAAPRSMAAAWSTRRRALRRRGCRCRSTRRGR